jgi:outer membrane protein insertion porin family
VGCSVWLAIGAVLFAPLQVLAQTAASLAGQRVVAVEYAPPEQPLDPVDLERAQAVKVGDPLDLDAVGETIDRLYGSGRYEDIRAEGEPAAGGGVIVRFITQQRWFISHVGAGGKIPPPPNRGQVTVGTQLSLGQPFDSEQLAAAQDNILRLFRQNGLYEAEVEPLIQRDPRAQQVVVRFMVRPGKRASYERPIIEGNAILSDDTIIKATGWRRRIVHWWREVTQSRTTNGLNGILKRYQKDGRLSADVRITKMDYDPQRHRLRPTLQIEPGPKIKVEAVEAKVSQGKLKKYVPVFEERRVDRDLLVEGARNLRSYFEDQGYYDVVVDFNQRAANGNDEVVIEYTINKGERHKLVAVFLEGNRYFEDETLRERMFLREAGLLRFRHGRYSEAMRGKDEENISNLYKSNGFRDVQVTSTAEDDYKGKQGDMAVTLHINEGPQWFVDNLEIAGMQQVPREDIEGLLASSPGQPYSELNVAADRTAILTEYYNRGYPEATFQWWAIPSGAPNHVNLKYQIHEGERRYVRDIIITGLRRTRPELVQNHMQLKKGDPLALSAMTAAQKSLYDTGIFAKVEAAMQNPSGNTTRKYVLYDIVEAARYLVNVGVGAEIARIGATTTNVSAPVGGTGFSPRVSLDVTRINFLGLGHMVTLRGRASNIEQMGSIDYVAPRFRNVEGRNVTVTGLYDLRRDVRTFASRREEGSIQVSQQLSKADTALFRLTYRRVSTSDVVIPTLLVPSLLQPVRLGMFSTNFVEDRRDNPTDAHRGRFNSANLDIATRILGSQRSFIRALVRNATYTPLHHGEWVFARQTTFGVVTPFSIPQGLTESEAIPLPERFFGGGSTSHRGFPENQAGPRDLGTPVGPGGQETLPTGFPLGGNAIFFNTFELRFPFLGQNIGGVLFHDAGNVYSRIGKLTFRQSQRDLNDFDYMVHAVGFGIRYRTPVGPVRIDLAYSINPPSFLGFKGTTQELLKCDPKLPPDQLPDVCRPVRQNVSHLQFFFSIGQAF